MPANTACTNWIGPRPTGTPAPVVPAPSRLRIDFRQFVGDGGSKVAGLRGTGSPAQILVRIWTKGRSRLAERYCAATAMVKADTSSRAEPKGHSHRQMDARDPGRGGRSYTADRDFVARRATAAGRSPGGGVANLGR